MICSYLTFMPGHFAGIDWIMMNWKTKDGGCARSDIAKTYAICT